MVGGLIWIAYGLVGKKLESRAWAERKCLTRLDKVFTGAVDALA